MLYFGAFQFWNIALADSYLNGHYDDPSVYAPGLPIESPASDYIYGQAFLADPQFWNRLTRTGPAQWRAIRADEVLFPSAKSLLVLLWAPRYQWNAGPSGWNGEVAQTDGSARTAGGDSVIPGYFRGEGNWPSTLNRMPIPMAHTVDGVRGRDLR